MKNILEYYYNIYPDTLYENGNAYYFFVNDIKYYFLPFNRNINELNDLVELTNKLYFNGIKVHTFICTKEGKYYIEHEKTSYVLLRVNIEEKEEIDIYDIIKFNNLNITSKNKSNNLLWIKRWEHTVDSFEREVGELNNDYPLLTSYFNYYVGLAENAISYVKTVNLEDIDQLFLSHKRIKTPLPNPSPYLYSSYSSRYYIFFFTLLPFYLSQFTSTPAPWQSAPIGGFFLVILR